MTRDFATAGEVRALVTRREATATDVCRAALDRIAKADPALHAFVTVDPEGRFGRPKRWTVISRPARHLPRWPACRWP